MNNPYASPVTVSRIERPSIWPPQVRVVAVLLLIQGFFECAVGFLLLYQWTKSVLSVAIIGLVFVLGILKIVAGVRNFQRRSRILGIIAISVAPLSVFTLFCAPSALVIMVYGLVVYLHCDVKLAFAEA